jgi:hypothetical protein
MLAIALVAVVAGVLLAARSRRARPWTEQASGALDEANQITTHLVELGPDGLGAAAGADAARLAELMAAVERLVTSAPDDASGGTLASLQGPLGSLHGVVDAVAIAPTPPSAADVEQVRLRAAEVQSAAATARPSLVPSAPPPPPPPPLA